MHDSQIVKGWDDKAKAEGRIEGRAEGKAEVLLQVLGIRFKKVPDDLRAAILATQDSDRLTAWLDVALTVRSLRAFCKQADVFPAEGTTRAAHLLAWQPENRSTP